MAKIAKTKSDVAHLEQLLDDALAGTFPASDPVGSLTAEKKSQAEIARKPAPPAPGSTQSPEG